MARYYLQNLTPAYAPATWRGGWDHFAHVYQTRACDTTPGGSGNEQAGWAYTGTGESQAKIRFVSTPLAAPETLEGLLSLCVGANRGSVGTSQLEVAAYVTTGDTDTPRGILVTEGVIQQRPPFLAAAGVAGQVAVSTVNAQAGDRIVVELGDRIVDDGCGNNYSKTYIRYGSTHAGDLVAYGNYLTPDDWFEFVANTNPIDVAETQVVRSVLASRVIPIRATQVVRSVLIGREVPIKETQVVRSVLIRYGEEIPPTPPPTPEPTVATPVTRRQIRRLRRTPHLSQEQGWIIYDAFQLDLEAGQGVIDEPGEVGVDPQLLLRWSDDGGHTWSHEHWVSAGPRGEYRRRAIWRRLGRSRDRVFEVVTADPIKVVWLDAFLRVTGGTS